ncbi:hypothetical protein BZL29_1118 [Mycobacterium kansasii]|uniref:Uncharacterized protein n=1 Tax=Mycobacterium kansasii TaxID=1768 RepID=A0A1V3XXR3_MYCKA|nr:hypothetical protein BZL29_1118 [Mycobacterium kansasii]
MIITRAAAVEYTPDACPENPGKPRTRGGPARSVALAGPQISLPAGR